MENPNSKNHYYNTLPWPDSFTGRCTPGLRVHDKKVTTGSCCGSVIGPPFPKILKASTESSATKGHDGIGSPHTPMHPGSFESSPDGVFASGFHHSGGGAQPQGLELSVAHPMAIFLKVVVGGSSLLVALPLRGEDRKDRLDPTRIEFPATLFGPSLAPVAISIQTLGQLMQSLLGVETIDDLHGLREQFPCQVPDPFRRVA